jgi:putative membrane protein
MQKVKTTISLVTACLPAIVYVIWLNAYYWLLKGGRYKAFIQPKFWPLLILALLLLLAFSAAFISQFSLKSRSPLKFDAWLKAAILMMPVFFLLTIYGRSLGTDAFSKRALNTGRSVIQRDANQLKLPSRTSTGQATSLLNLLADAEKFDGKRVTAEGMVYRSVKSGDNTFMLFRFAVVCCAADAMPLSVTVKHTDSEALNNDAWVRVDGIFTIETSNGKQVPSIAADIVQPIPPPPPEKRYLFF